MRLRARTGEDEDMRASDWGRLEVIIGGGEERVTAAPAILRVTRLDGFVVLSLLRAAAALRGRVQGELGTFPPFPFAPPPFASLRSFRIATLTSLSDMARYRLACRPRSELTVSHRGTSSAQPLWGQVNALARGSRTLASTTCSQNRE